MVHLFEIAEPITTDYHAGYSDVTFLGGAITGTTQVASQIHVARRRTFLVVRQRPFGDHVRVVQLDQALL
jgi:hypothetical protein